MTNGTRLGGFVWRQAQTPYTHDVSVACKKWKRPPNLRLSCSNICHVRSLTAWFDVTMWSEYTFKNMIPWGIYVCIYIYVCVYISVVMLTTWQYVVSCQLREHYVYLKSLSAINECSNDQLHSSQVKHESVSFHPHRWEWNILYIHTKSRIYIYI